LLRFHEVGEENVLPLFVARKALSSEADATQQEARQNAVADRGMDKPDGMDMVAYQALKLRLKSEYYDRDATEFDEDLAEYAFYHYPEHELVFGFQVNFANDPGKMRLELWKSGTRALMYQYSTLGFRRLTVFDEPIQVLIPELEKAQERFGVKGNRVASYRSLAERAQLESEVACNGC